jgi:hypothetical protein
VIVSDVRLSAASSTAGEILTIVCSVESARPQSCLAIQALLVHCRILLTSHCSNGHLVFISASRESSFTLSQPPIELSRHLQRRRLQVTLRQLTRLRESIAEGRACATTGRGQTVVSVEAQHRDRILVVLGLQLDGLHSQGGSKDEHMERDPGNQQRIEGAHIDWMPSLR